jgi:hypothetical protein
MVELYLLVVGMLYPAYRRLQLPHTEDRTESEEALFWRKYFVVFSVCYAGSEILLMSMFPLVAVVQVVGVSMMVLPQTQVIQTLYPLFVKSLSMAWLRSTMRLRTW